MTNKKVRLSLRPQMTIEKVAKRLFNFNKWRSGEDSRTMDEAGLKPEQITLDIDFACQKLLELHKIK
jgi:hypothetical protein